MELSILSFRFIAHGGREPQGGHPSFQFYPLDSRELRHVCREKACRQLSILSFRFSPPFLGGYTCRSRYFQFYPLDSSRQGHSLRSSLDNNFQFYPLDSAGGGGVVLEEVATAFNSILQIQEEARPHQADGGGDFQFYPLDSIILRQN